jgi:alcohol dehydrogenase class IV
MAGRISLFRTTPRIVMGPGAIDGIGREVESLGAKRVLVVTDPGIIESGLFSRIEASLKDTGLEVRVFSDVTPDPRYEIVEACLSKSGTPDPDCVIGLGGGSPMDIAKCVAVVITNGGSIYDYLGVDLVPKPGVPTIMVPTTAGTGSEVTPIAILSDEAEKLKKGVVSSHLFPRVALLDPELTVSMPPHITAATGMDAWIHAIEAFTSVNATPMTDMLASRSMVLINENLRTAYAQGGSIEARAAMLEGSLLAGMAFANAGVTAVHAFAYPIGAEFHIPHGVANSIMLASVMEFNMLGNLPKFARMAELLGENTGDLSQRDAAMLAVNAMKSLAADVRIPRSLGEFGIKEEHVSELARGVMKVTRLLDNNPRTLTISDAEEIYRRVL